MVRAQTLVCYIDIVPGTQGMAQLDPHAPRWRLFYRPTPQVNPRPPSPPPGAPLSDWVEVVMGPAILADTRSELVQSQAAFIIRKALGPRAGDFPRMTAAAASALARWDLGNFLLAIMPGGIEAQEAWGQRDLVSKKRLPVEAPWALIESWGVKRLRPTEREPLFYDVELPEGWTLVATSHSMWSELRDATGKVRLDVFFKAAFYDKNARAFEHKEAPSEEPTDVS